MDYFLISDFHPLSSPSNAVWKFTFSNSASTPLPCCPPSDCQHLWFSIITECVCVINACRIYIFIMKSYTRYTINRKWKKDKEKINTQNKNTFKTTLIRIQLSSAQRINHNLNVCVSKVFTYWKWPYIIYNNNRKHNLSNSMVPFATT